MALDFTEIQDAWASPKKDFWTTVNPTLNTVREAAVHVPHPYVRTGMRVLASRLETENPAMVKNPDMPFSATQLRKPVRKCCMK